MKTKTPPTLSLIHLVQRSAPAVLALALFNVVRAQTTFTDNFNVSQNYLSSGVAGSIWDGVYFGANEFPRQLNGNAAGSTLICNANVTSNNVLTVQTTQTDWEGTPDDGFFLYKVISGDFSCSVHVVPPYDNGAFNTAGLQARIFGRNGAPPTGENFVSFTRFDEGIANYFRTELNGAVTQRPITGANTNYYLMLERVGNTFNAYERATTNDSWAQVDTQTRADFNTLPVQIGIIDATFNNGATPRTAVYDTFSLTASNLTSVAPAAAPTGLVVTTNANKNLVLTWTPGAGSDGTFIEAWTGNALQKQAPANGQTYNANVYFGAGDPLPGNGYSVVFSSSGGSTVVSNTIAGTTYNFAVYSYVGSGASRTYTPTPATVSASGAGTLANVTLVVPTTPILGSARLYSVLAAYDNGATADVTATASVTSSNNAIASIPAVGRMNAVALGTVGVKAVLAGQTNIQLVTVSPMAMTYEWSFNEPTFNLTVTDSVQNAVGVVSNVDGATGPTGSGLLSLGGSGGYVTLPPNLLTNYGSLTIETWATASAVAVWERIMDFGNGTATYMFLTPYSGGGTVRFATLTNGGGEQQANHSFTPDANQHQYAVTISGATRTAKLYFDGVLQGVNTNFTATPEIMGATANDFLGKSQFPVDPTMNGSIAEFRIYNGELDAFSIAAHNINGPDTTSTNIGTCTNITASVPLNPIDQFGVEQITVIGQFDSGVSIHLESATQTTYSGFAGTIVSVSPLGLLTAQGPGTTTINISSFSKTTSLTISVNPLKLGMTHRWPFNTDFNDLVNPNTPAIAHNTVNLDGLGNAVLDGSGNAGGTTGSYIELPSNMLLGYNSISFECWFTDMNGNSVATRNWSRLWDVGTGTALNFFATPFVGGLPDTFRVALTTNGSGAEYHVNIPRPATNVEHHLVFVHNQTNNTGSVYVDGALLGQNRDFQAGIGNVGANPNNWIGRSQYGDPLFVGLIDEFRVYNGTVDPVQIGIDYVTGPNTIVTNPGALTSVAFNLNPSIAAGNPQQAQALANFVSVSGVPVTPVSSNWISSDATVAKVDQYGVITAIGPGTAAISATYNGVTGSSNVTVTASSAPVLANRYSFNAGDATDSVGGQNGTVSGAPAFVNGSVILTNAANSDYISLPGHLFDTNLEVTIETWSWTTNGIGSGAALWDFGNSATLQRFAFTPSANGSAFTSARQAPYNYNISTPSQNSFGRYGIALPNAEIHHTIVVSDLKRRVDFYVNGKFIESVPYKTPLNELQTADSQITGTLIYMQNNMTEGYIGRGVGGGLLGYRGAVDELRIWKGAFDMIQAQVSDKAGPNNPTIDPGAVQSVSVTLSDTAMVLGGYQHPAVSATFANVTGAVDLTGHPGVVFSSSDPSKIAVVNGADSKLHAVGIGSATITASYGGKSATNTVSVFGPPTVTPTHVYSFSRGNANDAIGHANAQLLGNAVITGGKLVLDGSANPPSYAQLPSDLISGYDKVTFEAFYNAGPTTAGQQHRLWDFGSHVFPSGNVTGEGYLYEAAGRAAVGMAGNSPGGQEVAAIVPAFVAGGGVSNTVHVVVTVDSTANVMNIYTNGVLGSSVTNNRVNLAKVVDNFNFLGRSQWGDPHYIGSISDFRVYYGVLTPAQIAASYAAGASFRDLTVTAGPGANQVTISWPEALTGTLQTASSLSAPTWVAAGSPTLVNGYNQVIVNTTGTSVAFYRLARQ